MKVFVLIAFLANTLFATALHTAVLKVDQKRVEYLVKNGADVNAIDENGRTPLHYAAQIGRFSIIKYLVEHGANLTIEDKYHNTPLVYAIKKNHIKAIVYLSKKVNEKSVKRETY